MYLFSLADSHNQIQRLAFVQYTFDRNEHPIELKPHGNSKKKNKLFSRSKPSTIELLKKSAQTNAPRKALREVENIRGGVVGAQSGCDLPQNRKQVYNLNYAKKNPHLGSGSSLGGNIQRTDVLAQVMQMCKESTDSSMFVRSVEAAPESMCILASDQQLTDIERFCMGDSASVLSIDPTFNLGPFYVTPTTYHNLLVTTENGNHPILLGSILIYQTFRPFHYLASTLVRLNPRLINIKSFGTDGEPELIKAFNICFPNEVHLRCTNHLRQNIKDKLRSLNIPQSVWKEFLADILGNRLAPILSMVWLILRQKLHLGLH